MSAERILVVDDNPTNLKLACYVLEGEGYSVAQARDAGEALASLDLSLPELILMDIQMPGMDGLSLTRVLKADPAFRHIAIVALTSFAMKGDDLRARDAGCDAYISKPMDTVALPLRIAEILRGRAAPKTGES